MRRPAHRTDGPTMGDRFWYAVGCAVIGAFWGAVVIGAWMYLGHPFSAGPIVMMAAGCAVLGLLAGEAFADLMLAPFYLTFGFVLGATDVDDFLPSGHGKDDKSAHLPTWLKLMFWAGFIVGVLFWLEVF